MTRTFPGAAPCDTTLQACIDAVPAGTTIQIDTNARIDESPNIYKSLTLEPAPGFKPLIGSASSVNQVYVSDELASGPISVDFERLHFDGAYVNAFYRYHPGDSFRMVKSSVDFITNSNNDTGVNVDIRTRARVEVEHNKLRTSGVPLEFATRLSGNQTTYITAEGNRITGSGALINRFHGLYVDATGAGRPLVNLHSNLVHHGFGCNCGGSGDVAIEAFDTARPTVNMVGNTIDRTFSGPSSGHGIEVLADPGTHLTLNLFDNIVSRSDGRGIELPPKSPALAVRSGFNDFFSNGQPNQWNGYGHGRILRVDPRYMSLSSRDYRLKPGSPLRDAGLDCTPGELGRTDAAGKFRIAGPRTDIGAYEFGAGPVPKGRNVFGDDGANHLTGSGGRDLICGLGGADVIHAGSGGDIIYGGPGPDRLFGQGGSDRVIGEQDPDLISGGDGADTLLARDGSPGDSLQGGPGVDSCIKDPGDSATGCP